MTSKQHIIEWGINKPLKIPFPDCYWDILFAMAQLQGREVEDLATERLKQIIIEDVRMDDGYYGKLLSEGWESTLKEDQYYRGLPALTNENKLQLSPAQLLDLITRVEQHVQHIKPLLTMILNNPTVGMNDYLHYNKTSREQLTKMTRMLMAAASDKDFSTVWFMRGDDK